MTQLHSYILHATNKFNSFSTFIYELIPCIGIIYKIIISNKKGSIMISHESFEFRFTNYAVKTYSVILIFIWVYFIALFTYVAKT